VIFNSSQSGSASGKPLIGAFPQTLDDRKSAKKLRINCQAAIAAPILKNGMSPECVSVIADSAKYTKIAKLKAVLIFMSEPFPICYDSL
jgi:hypothetical protein|tara:strand:+ start:1548 stop:1814 length:267 start_codon:yes stop_codon:yes gene_type:complete